MREAVVLKSNRYGIQLHLNPEIPFDELLQKILEKFSESDKFFKDASFAISFEGRELTEEEETAIVEAINENTNTHVICIVAEDEIREEILKRKTEAEIKSIPSYNPNEATLRYESVKSGDVLIAEQSLVVLGDVEEGATVTTAGNLIVLGELKGNVWAGSGGREDVFVFAMNLSPESLRIASLMYAATEEKRIGWKERKKKHQPRVARIVQGCVQIQTFEGRS
ncbi:MAG: septum site-determining protein MinC [Lachnospiraceae bacterium]|nr:septum site-determining protein MinC [Lachnospiraceae bacterium]